MLHCSIRGMDFLFPAFENQLMSVRDLGSHSLRGPSKLGCTSLRKCMIFSGSNMRYLIVMSGAKNDFIKMTNLFSKTNDFIKYDKFT